MKRFRPAQMFTLLLLAALLLSACGGNNNGANADQASGTGSNDSASEGNGQNQDSTGDTKKQEGPVDPLGKYEPAITVTSVKGLSDNLQKQIAVKADVVEDNIWNRGYLNDLGIKVKYLWTVPNAHH